MPELLPLPTFMTEDELAYNLQLQWDLQMPPSLDVDRIVVNVDRLHRVQKLGGIGMSIVTGYQGERTEYTPGISGMNMDGTAIASKAGTLKAAEEFKSRSFKIDDRMRAPYDSAVAVHEVNKAALADTISDKMMGSKDREKVWATELDSVLRRSLRAESKKILVSQATIAEAIFGGNSVFYPLYDIAVGSYVGEAVSSSCYGLILAMDSYYNYKKYGSSMLSQRRWSLSLFGEFQPDRYVVASAVSRIPGLISVRK